MTNKKLEQTVADILAQKSQINIGIQQAAEIARQQKLERYAKANIDAIMSSTSSLQSNIKLAAELLSSINVPNTALIQQIMQEQAGAFAKMQSAIQSSALEMAQYLSGSHVETAIKALSEIDKTTLGVFQSSSFKSLTETINATYFDNKFNVSDFENFINQMQQKNNEEEIHNQATQNPILVLFLYIMVRMLLSFLEQSAINLADDVNAAFTKPKVEKIADLIENDRTETMKLTSNVNLRESPTKESESVDKLIANQTVIVIAEKKNWYKVRYFYDNDKFVEGWIYKRYAKALDINITHN